MNRGTKPTDVPFTPNGQESLSTLSAWAKALLRSGQTVKAEDYFSRVNTPSVFLPGSFPGNCQNRGVHERITHDVVNGHA
jgi:hypothetical protein